MANEHPRMPVSERAKIFVPFDPLRGFRAALAERERVSVPEADLTEEDARDLSGRLSRLSRGSMVAVTFYDDGAYRRVEGCVSRIDLVARELVVVDTRVPLDAVRRIEP